MEKQLRILSLVFLFGLISTSVIGQRRGCNIPSVTLTPTISHATCFNSRGSVSYEIAAPDESYVNIKLYDEDGNVVYEHESYSLSGQVSDLPVGSYRFTGSVSVQYECDGLWYMAPVTVDLSVWLGIETVWTEKIDMTLDPNNYSVKQNVVSNSLGGARSSNELDPATDGWMEMRAQYGTSTSSHIYWIVGETNPLGTFTINDPVQFIEFYKTTGGSGIRVRYKDFGGNYVYSTVSTNANDKVRLLRSGSNLRLQLNDINTTAFMFQSAHSGAMNIAVRSQEVGDGCVDVVSSFPCGTPKMFANLKYKLDGFYHIMDDGKIRFVFDQEYDGDNLTFNIYNHMDVLVKDQSDFPALATTNGDNYLTIDVSDDTHCIGRGFFYLEVINSKKEKMYLRFLNDFQTQACTDYIGEGEPTE